jgi:hypothetical protein
MRVVVHQATIAQMMSPVGEVGRATRRAAGRVRDRAKERATVDTGLMRNSIVTQQVAGAGANKITMRIGSNVFYTVYQELGTRPIYARRAPLLVFKVGNRWVSTYSTRGVPAARMLTRAIEEVSMRDFL